MPKLVISSDWHLNWVTHGVRRLPELIAGMHQVAAALDPGDTFVFMGDFCDPDTGANAFAALQELIAFATELRERGVIQYYMAGNHDVIEDGSGLTSLCPLYGLERGSLRLVHVIERPSVARLTGSDRNLVFLPFTASSHTYSPAEYVRANARAGDLVFGHLTIPGMHPGEETTDMRRGRDVLFPVEETEQMHRFNGHYHARQSFYPRGSSNPIEIPGSLAKLTFCEELNDRAFLIVKGE